MSRRPNRPRRPASQAKIRALRLMGWRYSTTREAWVHRAFGGRVGPVYIQPEYYNHPGVTEAIEFEAVVPFRPPTISVPEHERAPLPQRPPAPRDVTRVKVSLSDAEEPRVVMVDGKPPRRGHDELVSPARDAVVVPIKSARATG